MRKQEASARRRFNLNSSRSGVFAARKQTSELDLVTISSSIAIPICLGRPHMKRIFLAAIVATFAAGSAFAQDSCETKAMGKDGKPLAGAAKTSFMKKCMADSCEAKAVGSDGKKLAGAAKNSFMKKCESGA
jgi:hypothetical protein